MSRTPLWRVPAALLAASALWLASLAAASGPLGTTQASAHTWHLDICKNVVELYGRSWQSPDHHPCVAVIQTWLNWERTIRIAYLGRGVTWNNVTVDGKYGSQTGAAVGKFQLLYGLPSFSNPTEGYYYGVGNARTLATMLWNCASWSNRFNGVRYSPCHAPG